MPKKLLLIVLSLITLHFVQSFESSVLLHAQSPQQSASSSTDTQTTIKTQSNLVVLPITVKDQNGVLVPDLERSDFRVFDDQVEQSISVFTAEAFPLSLVVLIDDDLKSDDATQMVASLHALAAGISTDDEVMVCRFDLEFYPGDGFTRDADRLIGQLDDAKRASGPSTSGPVPYVTPPSTHPKGVGEPGPGAPVKMGSRPTKALDDAIYSAAKLLRDRGRNRRKLILVVSDGINGKQFNHHSYEDTRTELLRNDISVYSLAVGGNSYQRKFSSLLNYSNDTGGDIYYAAKSGAMEKLYSQIAEQARHEYTLAYIPTGNNRNSDYHIVQVRTHPGLEVKTRQGYFTNQSANSTVE